ncbi:MAG: DedA family protein [Candidatus Aenigmarchaeota archaeon]|nr:DedA family protein [Candidatus Aenigmarchaeota archaeon]
MVMVLVEILARLITSFISQIGYIGVFFLMVLESALIPIPSEVIMPFSGFLVSTGEFNLLYVLIAGVIGNLVGSVITYYLGLSIGRTFVLRYGKYLLIDENHLELAESWFRKFGDKIILVSRNLPAVRTYISLPAGISKMNVFKFAIYTLIGSVPWNFALLYSGVLLGKNWETVLRYTTILDGIVIAIIIILVIWWLRKRIK